MARAGGSEGWSVGTAPIVSKPPEGGERAVVGWGLMGGSEGLVVGGGGGGVFDGLMCGGGGATGGGGAVMGGRDDVADGVDGVNGTWVMVEVL